ncbi:MAG: hypothetical protein PHW76_10235, partial [Alphaproteobacteria bacterium]|nr:hypothetical protein [Alphaproteobacteria bacterium]
IPADSSVTMQYDGAAQRWRVTGSSNAGKALAAGSDKQVQYNDNGQMAGSAGLIWDYANSRLGLGTTAPVSSIHVATGGIFSVTGTYGSGDSLPSGLTGAGTRMLFYPQKAAFRAGAVDGAQWDNDYIGQWSFAVGHKTIASGSESTAMGYASTASGAYSVAIGYASTATGIASLGLGRYATAGSYAGLAVGQYNVGGGTTASWVTTDPIFEIGIGTSSSNKANAMTVLKNGNVGIGTASPSYPLDVSGSIRTSQAVLNSSSAPTLSSCGTSPSVATGSSNGAGQITMGTSATACTVTFANAYPTYAFCTVSPVSSYTGTYYVSAQSKSAFTLTFGTSVSSAKFNYVCGGN